MTGDAVLVCVFCGKNWDDHWPPQSPGACDNPYFKGTVSNGWRVQDRGGSWSVVWTGRGEDTIHDPHNYLSAERAIAVAAALNHTEAAEVHVLNRIREEVRRES